MRGIKIRAVAAAFATLCLTTLPTFAAPVSFTFTGVGVFDPLNTATGSFVIDDSLFDGSASQYLQNTNITQLSFTMTSSLGTTSFSFADVVTSDGAFYDSLNAPPSIANGSGFLASKSGLLLSINGPSDLSLSANNGDTAVEIYSGSWTEAPVAPTPIPGALPLFATGLAGLGLFIHRRKRKAA